MIFFTSDLHIGHKKILEHRKCFSSVEEMNKVLVDRWNAKVSEGDVIYLLGDVALCSKSMALDVVKQLKGTIRLVKGNHDQGVKGELAKRFEWIKDYYEAKASDGRKIVLCHYAFEVWNKSHYGSWHLHGHSHGSLPQRQMKRLDVCVENHNYAPYSMDEIEEFMATMPIHEVDHHVKRD